ncbi:major facilitator superfamily transporter [Diplogelasinospora grovesii]|uniref:Major facilitator superfamily transporter n=1 Tax=Diplogelasinospora grovesii TaxID=303347 RepID=A0AAN6N5X1_9PEZI|nr:major facilitator superfamily transporter [Diplogelasinospora grovesii]
MASNERGNESDTGLSAMKDETPAVVDGMAVDTGSDNKPVFKPTRDFLLAFLALCTVTLAVAFDATSLSVALPTMSTALGGTALEAFWSGTSFLLSSTVMQPSIASMSNIFGRKHLIYVTGALFAAGSLIAALAGNFTIILAGRTIQGIGGGGLIALTEVVVTDLVPLAVRGQWFSLLSAMWSIGTVTGPLIGAGFAENISWRWIFYINLPVIGLGLVFVVLFLHQAKIPGGIAQKLQRFDYFGSALFTASMTAFLFGLTTGGVMYEWSSWRCLLPLLIGPVGLVGFFFYEFRFASEPIINRRIFNDWDMIANYIMTVFHGAILWSLLYFLVLYYQAVKFYSPITSAVAILPETLTVAPAGVVVGIVAARTGNYKYSLWIGWVLTTFGAGLLLLMGPGTTVPQWIFLNIPIGMGAGMLFPAMGLAIQAACDPELNGQATAFFSFLRGLGQSIGVAISGVIFQNVFKQKLAGIPAFAAVADQFSRDATIVVGIINHMPDSSTRVDLVQAFSDSLRIIWISMLAFAAFCMVVSWSIRGYSLNQEHASQQNLVHRTSKTGVKDEEAVKA